MLTFSPSHLHKHTHTHSLSVTFYNNDGNKKINNLIMLSSNEEGGQ